MTVIIVHVPRTGGTTLRYFFMQSFEADNLTSEVRKVACIGDIVYVWMWGFGDKRVVCGHIPHGVHECLPTGPFHYVTSVRDPRDRVVSNFYFLRSFRRGLFYETVQNTTLEEYIRSGINPFEMENLQTKWHCGLLESRSGKPFMVYTPNGYELDMTVRRAPTDPTPFPGCDAEMLQIAKARLAAYDYVFLQPDLDAELPIFCGKFDLPYRDDYMDFYVMKNKPAFDELPVSTQELILERNAYDVELYDYVKGLKDAAQL